MPHTNGPFFSTSAELIFFFEDRQLPYQYVPAYNHRSNQAERVIQTGKSHFISHLNTTPADFPPQAFSAIIPQVEITMNMLRRSRLDSSMSAYGALLGPYNFNAHPMAPVGTPVMSYVPKAVRGGTYGDHAAPGFYVGPALHEYRCFQIFHSATGSITPCDTTLTAAYFLVITLLSSWIKLSLTLLTSFRTLLLSLMSLPLVPLRLIKLLLVFGLFVIFLLVPILLILIIKLLHLSSLPLPL